MGERTMMLIRDAMLKTSLDRRGLVNALGYRNRAKGFRKVDEWMSGVFPREPMLSRVAEILGLDPANLKKAQYEDQKQKAQHYVCIRHRDPDWHLYIIPFMGMAKRYRFTIHTSKDEVLAIGKRLANGSRYATEFCMGHWTCVDEIGRIRNCKATSREDE